MVIPQNYFIFISIFIVAIYIAIMIIGYNKGFLYELVNFAYTGLSLLLSWLASPVFAKKFPLITLSKLSTEAALLNKLFNLDEIINNVAYFIIIFLLLKLIYVILSIIVKAFNKIPVIGNFNQILGAVAGFFNATIITVFISLLLSLPLFANGKEIKEKTILKYVNNFSSDIFDYITKKLITNNVDQSIHSFDADNYRKQLQEFLDTFNNGKLQ